MRGLGYGGVGKGKAKGGRPQYGQALSKTPRVQLDDANPAKGKKGTDRAKPQFSTKRFAK